jgi:hypothetical protein
MEPGGGFLSIVISEQDGMVQCKMAWNQVAAFKVL